MKFLLLSFVLLAACWAFHEPATMWQDEMAMDPYDPSFEWQDMLGQIDYPVEDSEGEYEGLADKDEDDAKENDPLYPWYRYRYWRRFGWLPGFRYGFGGGFPYSLYPFARTGRLGVGCGYGAGAAPFFGVPFYGYPFYRMGFYRLF